MKTGIIGLPQVGKTSLFRILTKAHLAPTNPREAHIGVAKVPDNRLDRLAAQCNPKKLTHAAVEYVDLGAIGQDALKESGYIGHLRNAVLGDTFARLLAARGARVEVQNYIDNTGVQVADVIVGFLWLENKTPAEVRQLIEDPSGRFDYHCWDLYARVFQWYESEPAAIAHRAVTLKAIEEGHGETAEMAERVSTAIVERHLETMRRVNDLIQRGEIDNSEKWLRINL